MKAYAVTIERVIGDSWNAYIPHLDIGFYHAENAGGRSTLESAARSMIERLDGSKSFGLMVSVA